MGARRITHTGVSGSFSLIVIMLHYSQNSVLIVEALL